MVSSDDLWFLESRSAGCTAPYSAFSKWPSYFCFFWRLKCYLFTLIHPFPLAGPSCYLIYLHVGCVSVVSLFGRSHSSGTLFGIIWDSFRDLWHGRDSFLQSETKVEVSFHSLRLLLLTSLEIRANAEVNKQKLVEGSLKFLKLLRGNWHHLDRNINRKPIQFLRNHWSELIRDTNR